MVVKTGAPISSPKGIRSLILVIAHGVSIAYFQVPALRVLWDARRRKPLVWSVESRSAYAPRPFAPMLRCGGDCLVGDLRIELSMGFPVRFTVWCRTLRHAALIPDLERACINNFAVRLNPRMHSSPIINERVTDLAPSLRTQINAVEGEAA